jgi:RNA polymerase sigma-70 factor (ECF subfamily)
LERTDPLLAQAISGNKDALGQLVQHYAPRVRRRLKGKITRSFQSVLALEDVLQVTYLEAFLRIGKFNPGSDGAFDAWLTRIAENNLRDALRELQRAKRPQPQRRVALSAERDSSTALLELLGGSSTTPSRQAARGEAQRIVEQALGKLPADYQRAVRLYDLDGLSAADVAAAMGRSVGAFHMVRVRAHDRLRELLGSSERFFSDSR